MRWTTSKKQLVDVIEVHQLVGTKCRYSPYKMHNAGTVPTFEMYNVGTVPTFKMYNVGTVPTYKMHNIGTELS